MISLLAAAALGASLAESSGAVDPVVVTATRLPTPLAAVASSITVITAEDIARRHEATLADVLRDTPGLNLVQSGGPGGATSVFMRGTNANHVKVLIDGIDVGDPSSPNGAFDFGQLLTADIDRVEVLRGPQSGLYGSDAIGGVINVVTRRGEGPARATASLEGGSFDTFNQTLGVQGATGRLRYAAEIAHLRSGATPVTPLGLLAPGQRRNDDSYDNLTLSTNLGYDVAPGFDLGLVARYANTRLRLTGDNFLTGFPDTTRGETDTRQYDLRATAHFSAFAGRLDQTLGLAYGSSASTNASPDFATSYFSGDRVKIDWQGAITLGPGETLVLGAEHQRDGIRLPVTAHSGIDSGYAELQSNPAPNLNATFAVRYDANDGFGGRTTWRFAPTYVLAATGTKLKASIGTGFKAPTLSQRFQDFPDFGFFAKRDLLPESSTGYEAGFEQTFPAPHRFQVGATWYHNAIRNLIEDNATFSSYANVGRAHTQGVEAFVALDPVESVSLRADYTYTEAQNDVLNQALLRRPRHKWSLEARWRATERLSLDASLLSVGSWIDGDRTFTVSRLTAPGYTTVDIAADYDLTPRVAVFGRVANLFDRRYETPVGFQRPGRGVFAGVRARF